MMGPHVEVFQHHVVAYTKTGVYFKVFKNRDPHCQHWFNEHLVCIWCGLDSVLSGTRDKAKERQSVQGPMKLEP